MPKKIKPSLVDVDSVIYAVLSPGNGFLKKDGGQYYFYDALPRASGCYTTYEEADALRALAVEKTYAAWREAVEAKGLYSGEFRISEFWIKRTKKNYDDAMSASVVRLEWN
jgi:hypothetical protein